MRISDWSSDVCSSDLRPARRRARKAGLRHRRGAVRPARDTHPQSHPAGAASMIAPWRQMESHERVRELTRGWPLVVPSLTIVGTLLLVAVVPLVTTLPVLPDLAFALLIAWRLYRPDMVAPWAGLPLGIVADILTGQPVRSEEHT